MRRAALVTLGVVFVTLLLADWIAPAPYERQFRESVSAAPSAAHPLGTDALGRDRLSRLLHGGRISIVAAPLAALLAVAIALGIGLAAGSLGGWWERAFATMADLALSLPWLFLLLAMRAMVPLNASLAATIVATFGLLGLLGWAGPSRVALAAVKRAQASEFALAARASGVGRWRIAVVHVLPHLRPVALAQFCVAAPAFLLAEANLGLLGLGVAEPAPSWGGLLRELENFSETARQPWTLAPLAALALVVTCFQTAVSADRHEV